MAEPSLTLIVLRSPDIDRLRDFYEALGVVLVPERHGSGPDHYSATLGRTVLEFYPGNGRVERGTPGDVRIGLEVDDLDVVLGGAVAGHDVAERDGHRVVVARDPDGRAVELTERRGAST